MLSIPLRLIVGIAVVTVVASRLIVAARHPQQSPAVGAQPSSGPKPPPAGTSAPAQASPDPALVAPAPVAPQASSTPALVAPAPAAPQATPTRNGRAGQTTHGRLVLDGYFAQRIGLLDSLKELDLPGKTVLHSPQEHLITAFVNVLAGHTQLQEISRGNNSLRSDLVLARAWGQQQFPDVSGVCRQLHAANWQQAEEVRERLRRVFAPYIALCVEPMRTAGERLVVDWDLCAKAITTDAQSDPFAAYGHMEEDMGRGYQWAEATVRGRGPDGLPRSIALGGFLRPGNAHPGECAEGLRLITEAALGHPRRRPELLARRLAVVQAEEQRQEEGVAAQQGLVDKQRERLQSLDRKLQSVIQRRAERKAEQKSLIERDERAMVTIQERLARAQGQMEGRESRLAKAQLKLAETRGLIGEMKQRQQRMEAENLALDEGKVRPTAIELIGDSQFGDSKTVASLQEEGYDFTTKAISASTVAKLRRREQEGETIFGRWEQVSANAEVAECTERIYAGSPHPLRLLGYRKHLAASDSRPAQTTYALFLTTIPAQERPAQETVGHYHLRGGTVELLNRQAKSYQGWRGHRLRHGPGLDILGQFVFAALTFEGWLADTVWSEMGTDAGKRPGLAELMQMARAPAQVITDKGGVLIQFTEEAARPHQNLRLGALLQPPLPGFVWPGIPTNAQVALLN